MQKWVFSIQMFTVRVFCLGAALACCSLQTAAQQSLEASWNTGYTVPNSPQFPVVKSPSQALECSWGTTTHNGRFGWAKQLRYPRLRASLWVQSPGNAQSLGWAIGFCPNLGFRLWDTKRWGGEVRLGMGVALLTKYYDKLRSPDNLAIGSSFNMFGLAKFLVAVHLSDRFSLLSGVSLAHFSNGGFARPNLGINTASFFVGARLRISKIEEEKEAVEVERDRHFHPGIRMAMGYTERGLDGPRFLTYGVSLQVSRRVGDVHLLSVGAEYLYSKASEEFQRYIGVNPGRERQMATRYSVTAGHEFLFGHLGFLTELGVYLNKHYERRHIISTRIGFNFYPRNPLRHPRHQVYGGVHVLAYFGLADILETVLGYRF